MMQLTQSPRPRIRGLDGLRGIAVIAILLFHLFPGTVVGGWFGVPLFFVLSGYLITDLLIQEADDNHYIAYRRFYGRRFRRLYPSLVVMLLAVAALIGCFASDLRYDWRGNLASSLSYVYNFWAVGHGGSYFDQAGHMVPLTHLWSLAIEGQFYLLWPLLVGWAIRHRLRRSFVATVLLVLAVISAGEMALLYGHVSLNRLYYGTDTRLFALLLGAALAFVWSSRRLSSHVTQQLKRALTLLGALSGAIVLATMMLLPGQQAPSYQGVMFLVTIFAALWLATIVHPGSPWGRWLAAPGLTYLGERSYSLYLYQLPVFVFYERWVSASRLHWWHPVLEIGLVLVVAEVSYRCVERPLRRQWLSGHAFWHWVRLTPGHCLLGIVLPATILGSVCWQLFDPATGHARPATALQKQLTQNQQVLAQQDTTTLQSGKTQVTAADQQLLTAYGLSTAALAHYRQQKIVAIGDSVLLAAAPDLKALHPNTVIDADVGRQAYDGGAGLTALKQPLKQADVLLVNLGTNGTITDRDIAAVMATVTKRQRVYWVTNYVPSQSWQTGNNQKLQAAARKYPNLVCVDWYSTAQKHPEWFRDDPVHPSAAGERAYARLVATTIDRHQTSIR